MSYDLVLKNFVQTAPKINQTEIIHFSFVRKISGELIGIVKTISGETHIKRISPNGLDMTLIIKLPLFHTVEDRNNAVVDLYNNKGYNQSDIALFFSMSQSQVSNIIRKYNQK